MTDFGVLADKALRDEMLTREECLAVLDTPQERVLDLLNAAFRVRERHFGRTVRLQMLMNAKSGACQEDAIIVRNQPCPPPTSISMAYCRSTHGRRCAKGRRCQSATLLYCDQRTQSAGWRCRRNFDGRTRH